jgi:hypothetical protein
MPGFAVPNGHHTDRLRFLPRRDLHVWRPFELLNGL